MKPTSLLYSSTFNSAQIAHIPQAMCKFYAHIYTCKHTTHVLGKYCQQGILIQTPCAKRSIWQTLYMEEQCESCATPVWRIFGSGSSTGGSKEVDQVCEGVDGKRNQKTVKKEDRGIERSNASAGKVVMRGRRGRKT
jgi:hypothetical protein